MVSPRRASGNTGLIPLESTNIDISLEVYYGEASYISIGFFNKDVKNFIGTGTTQPHDVRFAGPELGCRRDAFGYGVDVAGGEFRMHCATT